MEFIIGEYVAGIETIGSHGNEKSREMRGWVDYVDNNNVWIRADDGFKGNRGTSLDKTTVHRCNHVNNWWLYTTRILPVGCIVNHFKNKKYKILGYADHVDGGRVVIYMALYGDHRVWVREYTEFMSKVDKKKYPDVNQTYRFEEVK